MLVLVEVPDSKIPKQQKIIDIPLHFIDGNVCEAGGYEFTVLSKELEAWVMGVKKMIAIKGMEMPKGCQRCKFFRKNFFGNGLDYGYSCVLGAKEFPMPWIRQVEERASDCPLIKISICEDAASREEVWCMITSGKYPNENDEQFIDRLVEELEQLPPVTPTRKV